MASSNESQLLKARVAFDENRLDEAFRLALPFRPWKSAKSRDLAVRIARALAHRAERHLNTDNSEEAWTDLINGESLGVDDPVIDKLRQKLTRLMIANARGSLREGDPRRCEELLGRLRDRGGASSDLDLLVTTCLTWLESRELAGLGEFQNSLSMLQRVERRLPGDEKGVRQEIENVQGKLNEFETFQAEFYDAVSNRNDPKILELGNRLLAIAPRHPETLRIRKATLGRLANGHGAPLAESHGHPVRQEAIPLSRMAPFYLWIDGVAGYLVMLEDRISIGHAGFQSSANLPWMADIGRIHVVIQRQNERFTLEPQLSCKVNGVAMEQPVTLQGDEEITLGESCRMLFTLPLQGSLTAILRPQSMHRPPVPVDGILLMGQTLSLASSSPAHLLVPGLTKPVTIFRSKDGLSIRSDSPLLIDGKKVNGPGSLPKDASVIIGPVSFSVEPAPPSLRI